MGVVAKLPTSPGLSPPGQDRNLFVESISVNGQTIASTAPGVTFDRATADPATAFDDQDVIVGTDSLWWNGALRFTLSRSAVVTSDIDALYAPNFSLKALATPSYIDPIYGTRVYKATQASDFPGASSVRHEYSRRQAFNANNSRYLAQSSTVIGSCMTQPISPA
jgi:hypothetical protein